MFLKNKSIISIILIIFIHFELRLVMAKEINAKEFYKSCTDYFEWVNRNYSMHLDEKTFFNMGKCQGVIETLGKTMLTLCYESRRNANINKRLTANLEGIKTISIIEKFLEVGADDGKLRSYSSHSYLTYLLSTYWPCK